MGPRELVHAWVEAFNKREIEKIASFYSEGATNYQVPESPVCGRDAIQTMFANAFALAEMVCIPENVFEDGEWAILEWRDPLGMRGCGFFHVVVLHRPSLVVCRPTATGNEPAEADVYSFS